MNKGNKSFDKINAFLTENTDTLGAQEELKVHETNNSVDYRFRILYVIGILCVLKGHGSSGGINLLYDWFPDAAYKLALFVFVSGYFYRDNVSTISYIKKKFLRLILPMYLWNFFYAIIVFVLASYGFTFGKVNLTTLFISPLNNGHQYTFNMGAWFFVPLFVIEVLNVIIRKLICLVKNNNQVNEWIYCGSFILLGILGNQLSIMGFNKGWWLLLARCSYFLPFFGIGLLYRRKLEQKDSLPGLYYFSIIFVAEAIIMFCYSKAPSYTPSWCENFTEGPIMPVIVGVIGIAFWLRIAKIIEPAIGQNKYINLIAENTYSITVNQFFSFFIVSTIYALFFLFEL